MDRRGRDRQPRHGGLGLVDAASIFFGSWPSLLRIVLVGVPLYALVLLLNRGCR